MRNAKLSGALLVWKGPPLALAEPDLRSGQQDGPTIVPALRSAHWPPPRKKPRYRKALALSAAGAAVVAIGGTFGLAQLQPRGRTAPPAAAPALAIVIPNATVQLAPNAASADFEPPAIQPVAIALPHPAREPDARATPAATPAAAAKKPAGIAAVRPPAPAAAVIAPAAAVIAPAPAPPVRPASSPSVAAASLSAAAALRAQGDDLFATGHLAPARVYYQRAADAGDPQAALQLGETYDPAFLAQAGLAAAWGNAATAAGWYRRAQQLGAADAALLLKAVTAEAARPVH